MSNGRRMLLLGALGAGSALFVAIFAVRHGFFDLDVYYGAIKHWAGGGDLYSYVRPGTRYGFTYPPFAALTMLPMALVPWHLAVVIGSAATVLVTLWLLRALLQPMIVRFGWTPWFAVGVAFCLTAMFEPFRETFLFGQVNMLLVALVAADLLLLVARKSRYGGVGIGLAMAIKLTPGIFLIYLLLTKRWRAAIMAAATAAAATGIAALVAPGASQVFWTSALWNTGRVGELSFVSNQSLRGMVTRLDPAHSSTLVWALLVAAVLAVWAVRVRRAVAGGDEVLGLALTGLAGVLVSPVTWVHHLVWAIPALVLLVERGGWALRGAAAMAYAILCSRLVWHWDGDFAGSGAFLAANAYVWIVLVLLLITPSIPVQRAAQLGDGKVLGAPGVERLGETVRVKSVPGVKTQRTGVGREHV